MLTERQLQTYIMRKCKALGLLAYKFASPSRRGVPDLLIIDAGGYTWYCEVKSPGGRGVLRPLQARTIELFRAQGCDVQVVSSEIQADYYIRGIMCRRFRK